MLFRALFLMLLSTISLDSLASATCKGHFINPITDVCWKCLFPLSIGNIEVVKGSLHDTPNPESPIGSCPTASGILRPGLNIGYWEPMAVTDVTDTPYCLVNLGGTKLNLGRNVSRGGRHVVGNGQQKAFFHVHWYKYPLIYWLNLLTSVGCLEHGDFDIAYLSELDPTWQDSEMSFLMSPEAALFANPVAASSCAADAASSTLEKLPLDSLFWCAGSQGTHYPMTGHVTSPLSPVQTALLLTERMNYRMHREPPFLMDTSATSLCREQRFGKLPKSRYRYEMVNTIADGKNCFPSGHSTLSFETQKINMYNPDQYGFLVWRKRNCTFL